ncbi:MAG: methyl-accepting chemotaxis protein [Candidatus Hodarchaeales archaeon]|jgi:methyl-accepting chemotaxis protein
MKSAKVTTNIFNDPNYVKTIGLFGLISIVIGTIGFISTQILPSEMMRSETPVEMSLIANLGIGIIFSIGLRVIFKQSIYFRISLCFSLCSTVIGLSSSLTRMLGETLSTTLVIYGFIGTFCVLLVVYTIRTVQTPLSSLQGQLDQISEGHLTIQEEGLRAYGTEFGDVESSLTNMAKNISQIILDSQKASKDLFTSSEELASTSHEVNALSEEITATIQQISRSASNQSELAIRGIGDVKEMSEAVDQTLQNIETSMQVIEDIASQTNILALNAAIEAARAGEFGRGFAVVADNVRRLAEETKENAVDIKSLTEEIVNSIGGSVITLQETLQGFAAQSEEFSASSEQVAAATEEQSASMHQMTQAAQDLAAMSVKLSNQVMEFKL